MSGNFFRNGHQTISAKSKHILDIKFIGDEHMSVQQNNQPSNQPSNPGDALKRSGEDGFKNASDKAIKDAEDHLDSLRRGAADGFKRSGEDAFKNASDIATKAGRDTYESMRNGAADSAKKVSDETLAKGRETFESLKTASSESTKLMQHAASVSAASGKVFTAQLVQNTMENAHAMMENFNAMMRAKSIMEAIHIQSNFIQLQMSTAAKQFEELLKLSTSTAQKVIHSIDQNIEGVRNASSRNH